MKTRTLLLLLVGFVLSFVLPPFAQHSLAQNFPTYHQLGPAKGHIVAALLRNTEHRNSCDASYEQLSQSGRSQMRQRFCGALHEHSLRQQ
jgi:hypothetical protein